jgi:hypothetical protein
MTKIPAARAYAADASLPTFVELGKVFFKILFTQANGGSNSMVPGFLDSVGFGVIVQRDKHEQVEASQRG